MEVLSYNQNNQLPKNPAKVMQNVQHGSMIHLLQGMTELAKYADSLFTSIAKETSETFQRIDSLSHRVEQAQQTSAVAHESILRLTLAKMLENYKAKFTVEKVVPKPIAHPSNRPFMIEEAYKKANPLPNLEKMQPLTEDGKSPAKLYSDPEFFYEDWREQERKRQEVRRQQRKQRDVSRNDPKRKKPTSIKKYRYDSLTGARILISEAECTAPIEVQIPLPSSGIAIMDEENYRAGVEPQVVAAPVQPAVPTFRVVTPIIRSIPQPAENRNDLDVPLPATIRREPQSIVSQPSRQDTPAMPSISTQPPAASIPVAPPLPPSIPPPAPASVPPQSTARSALLDAIRQRPTFGPIRYPARAQNPPSRIHRTGDKTPLVEILRAKLDDMRPAIVDSDTESESEGNSSDWD